MRIGDQHELPALPACIPPSPPPPCSEAALRWLGADAVVMVGDFGEEAVQVRELGDIGGQ